MTDRLPSIKLTIDPRRVVQLSRDRGIRGGGVRMKTTVYIVEQPDIPLFTGEPTVTVVTVPANEKIGVAVVREDETLEEMKVGIIG